MSSGLVGDGGEPVRQASLEETLHLLNELPPDSRVLLVLDGLEKIQGQGGREAFGRVLDGRIRSIIIDAVEGYFPALSLLVTTRFWLYDARRLRDSWYQQIDIDRLPLDSCTGLLRQHGVHGSDAELEGVAEDLGRHALSVDLMGGYLTRFCGGDCARLPALADQDAVQTHDAQLDPAVAAIQEQERRLARLAKRYHDSLRSDDPAALALLQRLCLFRLGINLDAIAAIFTGKGKAAVSGRALASLSRDQVAAKLALLTEMRLIERAGHDEQLYAIHPAVRDGFERSLDPSAVQLGHEAAGAGLQASLGDRPSESRPSDPQLLDLLEEIVYHTLSAGRVADAWKLYRQRMGGYENLLWRLGSAERGDRICRAFLRDNSSIGLTDLNEVDHQQFTEEWTGYLSQLGRNDIALECMREASFSRLLYSSPDVPTLLLSAGRVAEAAEVVRRHKNSSVSLGPYLGRIATLQGESRDALTLFGSRVSVFLGRAAKPGTWIADLLVRLGRLETAEERASSDRALLIKEYGSLDNDVPYKDVILAQIACLQGASRLARERIASVHSWASTRDAKELLCLCALVRAKIELHEVSAAQDGHLSLEGVLATIQTGLRFARQYGYALHNIDLLLLRAQFELLLGDPSKAELTVRNALFDGMPPQPELDRPGLFAATDPSCGYAWAIAQGRRLLAESMLLRAAQLVGESSINPASRSTPRPVSELMLDARQELEKSIRLRKDMLDPALAATKKRLADVRKGRLTSHRLRTVQTSTPTSTSVRRFAVALSFPSEHRTVVADVAQGLVAELGRDRVFYDEFYEAELARPNLDTYLQDIYRNDADLVVVFLCADYEHKQWCRLEWRAVRDLITRRDDDVMPIRLDDCDVSGVLSLDGFLDARGRTASEISTSILVRLRA
ncbi:MAG: TIR domain-containing protein [Pseudomonadota bacterium]